MNRRPEDWPVRLAAFFERKRSQPFDYARNNCAFFACDWLLDLTGRDHARTYRRRVKDALSAARVLKAAGGVEAIAQKVCAKNNWPEIPAVLAGRGDIVLASSEEGSALGVCDGLNSGFPSAGGLLWIRTITCRKAWRI